MRRALTPAVRPRETVFVSLTVHQLAHSPYCLPVTRALEALGVPFTVHNVSNGDRREIIELTGGAYYQVPVLQHDGRVIYESSPESTDVARYLDATFAGGRLFPPEHEGLQRIVVGHIENDIEGVTFRLVDPYYVASLTDPVDRVMVIRHKERKFGAGCLAAWERDRPALFDRTTQLLTPFDLALRARPYLFGDTPLYADFAFYGVLGNMTWQNHNSLPPSLTALRDWFEKIKSFRFP